MLTTWEARDVQGRGFYASHSPTYRQDWIFLFHARILSQRFGIFARAGRVGRRSFDVFVTWPNTQRATVRGAGQE